MLDLNSRLQAKVIGDGLGVQKGPSKPNKDLVHTMGIAYFIAYFTMCHKS